MSKYDIRRDFEHQNRILNVKTKIEKRKTNNEKRKANNEKRKTNNEKRKAKNEKQTNFTLLISDGDRPVVYGDMVIVILGGFRLYFTTVKQNYCFQYIGRSLEV